VFSLASLGFEEKGIQLEAEGRSAAATFEADRAQRAAETGRVQADQTDAQLREQLRTTLANIDVTRVAANTSLDSPTTIALQSEEQRIANRERQNRIYSIQAQASEDELAAQYKRKVAQDALTAGRIKQGAALFKGIGSAVSSLGKMPLPLPFG
jgi:hypothetical protein